MTVIFRGFVRGVLQFEEKHEIAETEDAESIIGPMAERHARTLVALPGGDKHMIEIEFPEDPDPLQRFIRFGTDSRMMVQPIPIDRRN